LLTPSGVAGARIPGPPAEDVASRVPRLRRAHPALDQGPADLHVRVRPSSSRSTQRSGQTSLHLSPVTAKKRNRVRCRRLTTPEECRQPLPCQRAGLLEARSVRQGGAVRGVVTDQPLLPRRGGASPERRSDRGQREGKRQLWVALDSGVEQGRTSVLRGSPERRGIGRRIKRRRTVPQQLSREGDALGPNLLAGAQLMRQTAKERPTLQDRVATHRRRRAAEWGRRSGRVDDGDDVGRERATFPLGRQLLGSACKLPARRRIGASRESSVQTEPTQPNQGPYK
jgi:hypothetical protein